MTFPTFSPPYAPSVDGTEQTKTPRIISNQFGDGYIADTPDGLNTVVGTVNLSWNAIPASAAATIDSFFVTVAGSWFYYTIPGEPVARLWISGPWKRTYPAANIHGMQVTLTERFYL